MANRFKGWDIGELFPVFGLEYPKDSDGEVEFAMLAAFLGTVVGKECTDESTDFEYAVMCEFLQALIDTGHSNYDEVYKGMLQMQDRHAFFKACMYLVETMWT